MNLNLKRFDMNDTMAKMHKLEHISMKFDSSNLIFNDSGLIPVIVQDIETNSVLMMAWMNLEAVNNTIQTRMATYWSRSRCCIWIKGEASGNRQEVVCIHADCDMDCLLMKVKQTGPACHTGNSSCFFVNVLQ